jgi:hypothetical protein
LSANFAARVEPVCPSLRLIGGSPLGPFLGAFALRVGTSRHRGSSSLAVVGIGLGLYVILAFGFHWLVEPTLAKNQPPPVAVLQYSGAPFAAGASSVPLSPVASMPPAVASTPPAVASTRPAVASTPPAVASTRPAVASTPPAVASTPPASTAVAAAAPDAMEKTNGVEPKKPPRKRVARERSAREPRNFWDFVSGRSTSSRPWF